VNLLLPDSLTTSDDAQWAPVRDLWAALSPEDRRKLTGVEPLLTPGAVADQVQIVLEAAPAAVVLTFATPAWFIEECRHRGIKVFALVGSMGKAKEASAADVDFIVVQVTRLGDIRGTPQPSPWSRRSSTPCHSPFSPPAESLTAAGLAAALSFGAAGVWVGTRFIASPEAYGHVTFTQRVIAGSSKDTTITHSYSGKRLRAFANEWKEQGEGPPVNREASPGSMRWQEPMLNPVTKMVTCRSA